MSPDPLDLIWRSSDAKSPKFTGADIDTWPAGVFETLRALGLLLECKTATHVTCTACTGEHVEEVTMLEYPDGVVRFYMVCPEQGRVEIEKEELLQWSVCFDPVLECIRDGLGVQKDPVEVVPSRLWNIGRSALAGRSRVVWVGRGLSWPEAVSFAADMPSGASPVLFYIGQSPRDGLVTLPPDSVMDVAQVVFLSEGKLTFDRSGVEDQVTAHQSPQKKKPPKKRASRTAAMESLKKAIRDHLIAARDHAYRLIEDDKAPELLPRPTQQLLAKQLKLSKSSISRALADGGDKELTILWEVANDLDQVLKYKRH
jgi:hypothetical protein